MVVVSFTLGFIISNILSFEKEGQNLIVLPKALPLEKYTIENLVKTKIEPGTLEPSTNLAETDKYTSYYFDFRFKSDFVSKKNVSGQMNVPSSQNANKFPLVIMLRGYVDQKLYKTGDGTRNTAKYFAENGFITIAPDFLGYGSSDKEAGNIFESRFQTYVTVLSLIESLDQISLWDKKNIFIWGHSNGGQIALTLLEVTGKDHPTSLWAPVSKPFPYSILYYTDESDDKGKLIRKELAQFEEDYDVEKYSLTNYFDRINSSLIIHQGAADDAVPTDWTNSLVKKLKILEKKVTYYTYPNTDHNLRPNWDTVVSRDLDFFNNNLRP